MTQPRFAPTNEAETLEAVRWAVANRSPLAIGGNGTKDGWGRPVEAKASLVTTQFSGIELYEPEELVLSARAGTSLAEIELRLVQNGQQLAFEPPDFGPLFGAAGGQATLGGAIACNLAGPRRIHAGAARDHVLGFAGVNGLGEAFKAGGRVVKNVTGFDLSKLLTGSFGTLAVLTQITLKVLPAAEAVRTVLVFGLEPAKAIDALGIALRSPHEVSGAAHLPERTAEKSTVVPIARAHAAVTAVRLEGTAPSVAARAQGLRSLLASNGDLGELDTVDSRRLWQEVRDVAFFDDAVRSIWHISVPPARGAEIADALRAAYDVEVYFDWGGGRLWLAAPDAVRLAQPLRRLVKDAGGHATLMRASDEIRRRVPVFQPPSPVEARLAERLKDNFDPHRILNPGRMYEGV